MTRTFLITGGTGFIGLSLSEQLLARGATVLALAPLAPPGAALEWFANLPGQYRFIAGDVRDAARLHEVLQAHHCDVVIHGAAITAGPERELSHAALIAEVNVVGTMRVLEAAHAAGIGRVMVLSSGSVFGPRTAPWPERLHEQEPVPVPGSLYGITKYAAECAALRYGHASGLEVIAVRLPVVFGRWEYQTGVRDTLSVPSRLVWVAQQLSASLATPESVERSERLLNLTGALEQLLRAQQGSTADWIYANDAAAALVLLAHVPALRHALYHVGTGHPWSVSEWCRQLKLQLPGLTEQALPPEIATLWQTNAQCAESGDTLPADVAVAPRPPFCTERLRNELGFAPTFDAASALRDYLQWYAQIGGRLLTPEPT